MAQVTNSLPALQNGVVKLQPGYFQISRTITLPSSYLGVFGSTTPIGNTAITDSTTKPNSSLLYKATSGYCLFTGNSNGNYLFRDLNLYCAYDSAIPDAGTYNFNGVRLTLDNAQLFTSTTATPNSYFENCDIFSSNIEHILKGPNTITFKNVDFSEDAANISYMKLAGASGTLRFINCTELPAVQSWIEQTGSDWWIDLINSTFDRAGLQVITGDVTLHVNVENTTFAGNYLDPRCTRVGRNATESYEDATVGQLYSVVASSVNTIGQIAFPTSSYAVQYDDDMVVVNASSFITTIIATPIAIGNGRKLCIKNVAADITVSGYYSTIDGETTMDMSQMDSINIVDYASGKWAVV